MSVLTFTVTSTNDGNGYGIVRQGASYPGGPYQVNPFGGCVKNLQTSTYVTTCEFLRFLTGGGFPAGAVVLSADLRFGPYSNANADNRSLVVDWGFSGSWPPVDADWVTPTGTAATVPLSTFADGRLVELPLAGAAANVSTLVSTGLILAISGGAPTGYNQFSMSGTSMYLDVTYTCGYAHKVNGVLPANIASINGIPAANIAKVKGV